VNPKLIATVWTNPTTADTDIVISFTANISGGVGGHKCLWNFGDATTSTICSTVHTYTTAGKFTATFIATDSLNIRTTALASLTINQPPTVDFAFAPTSPTTGQVVSFNATVAGGTRPYTLTWSFGDGTPGETGNQVAHVYNSSGSFNITLTIRDTDSTLATRTHSILLSALNNVLFFTGASTFQTGMVGQLLNFTVTASDAERTPVSIIAKDVPVGGSFYPSTGLFSWTPTAADVGNFSVTFTATTNSTPPTGSSETIVIHVTQAPGQGCNNCSIPGVSVSDEIIAGLAILGVSSTLLVSFFLGSGDDDDDDDESRTSDSKIQARLQVITGGDADSRHGFGRRPVRDSCMDYDGAD